jgi:hypothetical protein
MHFDPREQAALREAGLSTADLEAAAEAVAEAATTEATRVETFFAQQTPVVSDMDLAHSDTEIAHHEHATVDLFTHAADIRGFVRFDTWGAWVEDARVLDAPDATDAGDAVPRVVELTMGPTVHDRVRFATDPEML